MRVSSDPRTINTSGSRPFRLENRAARRLIGNANFNNRQGSGGHAVRWVALCLLVTTVIGCGRGGLQRVIVTGRVTYQGEAIANGEIRFVPTKGTQGPVSGGSIVEGVYTADGLGGVPVGTYCVEIRAFRAPKAAQLDPLGDSFLPPVQYLSEKYNTKTELEMTIEPGSSKITKDFDLAG